MKRVLFPILVAALLMMTTCDKDVTSVLLNKSELTLEVGEIELLTAIVSPANATDKTLTWNSSNFDVAMVANGVVTAISVGTTIISVTSTNNGYKATCTVKVVDIPKSGDVYVAGYEGEIGIVWKNGVKQYLTDRMRPASAYSVYVSGSDVYILSSTREHFSIVSVWKNGVAQYLTLGTTGAYANSVYVSGDDVYVAGWVGGIVTLWKNGEAQNLASGDVGANSVYVSGANVYVAGYKDWVATVWKNGVTQNLTDGRRTAKAYSVYVSGSDVYVAGYEWNYPGTIAKLWKNDIAQNLTDGTREAYANSVCISGSDVYVAGCEGNVATVWKNGIAQNLTDGTREAYANSVYVSGSDVYVAGNENDGQIYLSNMRYSRAKIWKNGVEQNLTDGILPAEAFSVFVVE